MEKPKVPSSVQLLGAAMQGPTYPPGEYQVRVVKNKDTIHGTIYVEYDENPHHSTAERDERHKYLMQAYHMLEDLAFLDNQIIEIRNQSKILADSVKGSLNKKLLALSEDMAKLRTQILATREGRITGEIKLREKIGGIYSGIMSYQGKPTKSQINRLVVLQEEMDSFENQVSKVIDTTVTVMPEKLETSGFLTIILMDKKTFLEKEN